MQNKMDYKPEFDIMRICRACLYRKNDDEVVAEKLSASIQENRQLRSIYEFLPASAEWKDSSEQIVELLHSIAPQLEKSICAASRPQMICGECLEQLRKAHQFQQMCISADSQMQQMLRVYDAEEVKSLYSKEALDDELRVEDPLEAELQATTHYLKLEVSEGDVMQEQEQVTYAKLEGETKLDENVQLQLDLKPHEVEKIDDDDQKFEENSKSSLCTKRSRKKRHPADSSLAPMTIKDEASAAEASSSSCGSDNDQLLNSPNKKIFATAINPEGYKCDECPRRFAKQESLSTHKATTHVPNQYGCDLCAKRFMLKRTLAKHRRRTHDESREAQKQKLRDEKETLKDTISANKAATDAPKLHVCKFCNKAFNQSCTLKDHLRIHTGEKPYLCSECGRGFNSSSNMKQHLLRHTGEKRYECPDCPKKFPCLSDLASHKAVHRKLKAHICDICGNAFGKPFQLKKHKMYHNGEKPHKCEYCEMRFVCADHMRRHMRTHTGEKPYKCKYCPRAFAQSNDLIKHLRSHLGENVYRCELCPCGFRLATELREHFAEHKSDDDSTRLANLARLMEEEAKLIIKVGGGDRGAGSSCVGRKLGI